MPITTIFRGGLVYDPETSSLDVRDVVVRDGRFAAPAEDQDRSAEVVDVSGAIVAPGLVDLHTHVFEGQDLGAAVSSFAWQSATTTVVDAGSAGGHLIGAFRRAAADAQGVQIAAMLNISSIGATSIPLAGELSPAYADIDVAIEAVRRNLDLVVGVKVRASANVGGSFTDEALRRARVVADEVELPLMVHLGPAPALIDDIAEILRPGDILTHAYTGWSDNSAVQDGKVRPSVVRAVERGVLLDVGHGATGFSFDVAETLIGVGLPPHSISSDLHAYSRREVVSLPTVMSKFLALGLSVEEVLHCATRAPAAAVRLRGGTLRPGERADLAILELRSGDFEFRDGFGASRTGRTMIEPRLTVSGGQVVFDARVASEYVPHEEGARR